MASQSGVFFSGCVIPVPSEIDRNICLVRLPFWENLSAFLPLLQFSWLLLRVPASFPSTLPPGKLGGFPATRRSPVPLGIQITFKSAGDIERTRITGGSQRDGRRPRPAARPAEKE